VAARTLQINSMSTEKWAIEGRFVNPSHTPGVLEYIENGLAIVENGKISSFAKTKSEINLLKLEIDASCPTVSLDQEYLIVPGFVDLHVHAPQYAFTGTATDLPLMEWLQNYTFPAERRMEDLEVATRLYNALVKRLLLNGTTSAVLFATIHLESSKVLVDICQKMGFRAFIGKVAMDQHGAENYEEETENSLRSTEDFILYCNQVMSDCHSSKPGLKKLIHPVITPRFIPTCSEELLHGLGELAKKYEEDGVYVQSHISESFDEVAFVKALHPDAAGDVEIFNKHGLLRHRCIMAHGVHLSDEDLHVMRETGSSLACCPLSNAFFAGKDLRLKRCIEEFGVRVGLGTDVAGGYSPSMLSSCRQSVVSAKIIGREETAEEVKATDVDFAFAFWTATLGGARALHLEDAIGSFEIGKEFDACIVSCKEGNFERFESEVILQKDFERFINLGDDRNIIKVYVQGQLVHDVAGAV